MAKMATFEKELQSLINRYSLEGESGTPDLILAEYLRGCLENYNTALRKRENWHGRPLPDNDANDAAEVLQRGQRATVEP